MFSFENSTAEQVMSAFFDHLARARERGPRARVHLHHGLVCLIGVHERQARLGPVDAQRLSEFRRRSAGVLADLENDLPAYVERTVDLAEQARDQEWYQLCVRRSVIQFVWDDYSGTPAAALVSAEEVAHLDDAMRRVGTEQGPVGEKGLLRGVPAAHWWWRYPASDLK